MKTRLRLTQLLVVGTLLLASLGLTTPVWAQVQPSAAGQITPIQNQAIPANLSNYQEARTGATAAFYLVYIWRALIFVGGLMVIAYFIMGAFEWISAQGEASKITAARNKMTGAIAGFVVLSALFVILEFIGGLFGFDVLNATIPTPTSIPTTTP